MLRPFSKGLRRVSVARAAVAAALAISLLLAATIALLILSTSAFDHAAHGSEHAAEIHDSIDDSARAVIDMESGLRAYLLTGRSEVLEPWRSGRLRFAEEAQTLRDMVGTTPRGPLLERLVAEVRDYVAEYGWPLIQARFAGPLPTAETLRLVSDGKARVDRIRRLANALESASTQAQTALIGAAEHDAHGLRVVGIVALALALAVLAWFGTLLARGLLMPLRRLGQSAERLSRGDLDARVEPASSELEGVAAAFLDVAERGKALRATLEDARLEVLQRLARATEYRDDDTHEHTERVGNTAAVIGRRLGLPDAEVEMLRLAAPLHDVGKIGVSDTILLKPGPLTPDEFAQMQRHTRMGADMLAGSPSPVLQMAERIALSHHERWDGTGYPDGLAGEAAPLVARIVAVADVYDALTHARPYKAAWPRAEAVAEIHRQAGRQFDPAVVEAFLATVEEPVAA